MSEKQARRMVRERSEGVCEVQLPGLCQGRATNFQHRKRKSQGGKWTAENGLDVCGSGTTGCHGYITDHPTYADSHGWGCKSTVDPLNMPVLYRQTEYVHLTPDGEKVPLSSGELVALSQFLAYGVQP